MDGYNVQDPSARRYFTMIPNIVIENQKLSHAAMRLYFWYKRVCGDGNGGCYQSLTTICQNCSMRRQTAVNARRELEDHKLVETTRRKRKDGSDIITVTIIDVWEENDRRSDSATQPPKGESERETSPGPKGRLAPVRKGDCKKTTLKKTTKKKISRNRTTVSTEQPSFHLNGRRTKRKIQNKLLTEFDVQAGGRLLEILQKYDIDLGHRIKVETLAENIHKLRTREKNPVDESRIKILITWYRDHYSDEYVPGLRKRDDFRNNFGAIEAAMSRDNKSSISNNGQDSTLTKDEQLACRVRVELEKEGWKGDAVFQEECDVVLEEMGLEAGALSSDLV